MRRALIVGISDYGRLNADLPGCVRDMTDWRDLLHDTYGFQNGDMRLVADARATRAEIMARLRWLLATRESGELVFIFAGHGARYRRRAADTGDLADGVDEALVAHPHDASSDDFLIFDDDLADLVTSANLPETVRLTCIIDACHAGGMLRGLMKGDDGCAIPRCWEPPSDVRHRELSETTQEVRRFGRTVASAETGHVIVAAAQDVESAWDAPMEDGARHGVFSYFAARHLRRNQSASCAELLAAIGPAIGARFPQHPQLLGNSTRFGLPFCIGR